MALVSTWLGPRQTIPPFSEAETKAGFSCCVQGQGLGEAVNLEAHSYPLYSMGPSTMVHKHRQ